MWHSVEAHGCGSLVVPYGLPYAGPPQWPVLAILSWGGGNIGTKRMFVTAPYHGGRVRGVNDSSTLSVAFAFRPDLPSRRRLPAGHTARPSVKAVRQSGLLDGCPINYYRTVRPLGLW